jgi:hypothetical protein
MPQFMDFHQDLKLPAGAIAQITNDTRHARADQFGVRQLRARPQRPRTGVLPARRARRGRHPRPPRRAHHAALGVPCGEIHQVHSLT